MSERRNRRREALRVSCIVMFHNGKTFYGTTNNITIDGMRIDCPVAFGPKSQSVARGDIGMITLRYMHGHRDKAMKLRGQIIHIGPNGMGMSIQFADLDRKDQKILKQMIETGEARL